MVTRNSHYSHLSSLIYTVSARTLPTIRFFPRIFLIYYALYHIYVFVFPYGFSYLALLTMVLFLQHAMYFFWHRYELPALYTGFITPSIPRMVTGDVVGQSVPLSSASFQIDSEFSTNAVVLEDEIEESRRIQQRQLVDLFLPAEVQRRQQAELSPDNDRAASSSPVRRHSWNPNSPASSPMATQRSGQNTPRSQSQVIRSPNALRHRAASYNGNGNRTARSRTRIEFLERNLPGIENDVSYSALRTSESAQSLFDFASAN